MSAANRINDVGQITRLVGGGSNVQDRSKLSARVSVLNVALYGKPIGTLTLLPGDRTLFAFHQEYIDDPERPTLSLSFKDQFGGLIDEVRPTRSRVPPFFSNLLPEGALRDYLPIGSRMITWIFF